VRQKRHLQVSVPNSLLSLILKWLDYITALRESYYFPTIELSCYVYLEKSKLYRSKLYRLTHQLCIWITLENYIKVLIRNNFEVEIVVMKSVFIVYFLGLTAFLNGTPFPDIFLDQDVIFIYYAISFQKYILPDRIRSTHLLLTV